MENIQRFREMDDEGFLFNAYKPLHIFGELRNGKAAKTDFGRILTIELV